MPALARTNHGNIFQSISFYKKCVEANIKCILGCEFYVAPDSHLNRVYAKKAEAEEDAKHGDLSYSAYHLTVLAKNRDGYENLKKLSTIAYRDGFYRKPRIDDEILAANKEGLIVMSGCLAGKISKLIVNGAKDRAIEEIDKMRGIFGEDFYLEVMNHNLPEEKLVAECIKDFSKLRGIPIVMTDDSHFTEHGDEFAHEVALAIGTATDVKDPDRFRFNGSGFWFKSQDEMYATADLIDIPEEALINTMSIANKVEDYGFKLTSKTKKSIIPLFRIDNETTLTDEQCIMMLEMKARQGLMERKLDHLPEYQARLKEELTLIIKKQFSSYFLIIADIIDFMRKKGWVVPIGRGSAGGSLTCYSLFITGVDPIKLGLSFSRFMNEGRKDLPDIDTDISQKYRGEVIEYIVNKYGKDRVAHIVTFQSMASKASSDNVGRGLGIPTQVRAGVGKLIGDVDEEDLLEDILEDNPKVREKMSEHPDWIEVSKKLEGNIRNLGAHAAGIVISNDPIINHTPLVRDTKEGFLVTQFDMADLGELGLLKLDMLGLKTIDVIQDTLESIKKRYGLTLDFHSFPIWDGQDPATYATIAGGKYVSCFQYDSHGIRGAARAMAPTKFDHIVALNALYRPGPMKRVGKQPSIMEQYIERRHGRQAIETWHPELNEVFKETYGLPLYQESVMAMARTMAGFNEVEADEYRAAIGKKDKVKFAAAQTKFKERGIKMGRSPELMDSLISKLEGFAKYGWNKSHCKLPTTPILTCSRGWVLLKDVKIGEELWSVRENTGEVFRNRVMDVTNNGVKRICRVKTRMGAVTFSTFDHRYMTPEQSYICPSDMLMGQSLKMAQQRIPGTNFNAGMAFPAHSNEIPGRVRLNDISGNNMMQIQPRTVGTTEHTYTPISIKQHSSVVGRNTTLNVTSPHPTFIGGSSNVIEHRPRIDKDITLLEPLADSMLALESTTDNFINSKFNIGSDVNHSIAKDTKFLDVTREGCIGGLKRQDLDYSLTAVAINNQPLNESFIDIIGVVSPEAGNTAHIRHPLADLNCYTTINTYRQLSVFPSSTLCTEPTDNCVVSDKDITTFGAENIDEHTEYCNWNIPPVTYNDNIESIEDWGEAEVWDLTMEEDPNFIANGFVVHNSVCYSYISFVTAHLETHYQLEYYTALLNVNSDKNDKLKVLLAAIIQKGVKLYPPHINKSGKCFETDGTSIYMGMQSVRQLGDPSIGPILAEREINGPFVDYIDFCVRMSKRSMVTKTVKENLVKAGAFSWDKTYNQKTLVTNTELIQLIIKKFDKKLSPEEIKIQLKDKIAPCDVDYTDQEKLGLEQAVLNFYITSHPVLQYQGLFNLFPCVNLITPSQLNDQTIGSRVVMLGIVEEKTMKTTKKGDPYLKMKLGDNLDKIYQNVWSPLATQINPMLTVGQLIILHGQVKEDNFRAGENQLNVNGIMPIMATHGLPITSFYAEDIPTANRILTTLNAVSVSISDKMLSQGHLVTLRGTAYIKPEMSEELHKCGRAYYMLAI